MQVAAADDACKDVTYEDPAEDLQALRECIDLERCAPVAAIWQPAQAAVAAALQARSTLDGATTTGAARIVARRELQHRETRESVKQCGCTLRMFRDWLRNLSWLACISLHWPNAH